MPVVEIIGAIDGCCHYDGEMIAALLVTEAKVLAVGAAFTGRPATRIHASDQDVLKIRAELDLTPDKARRWAANMLEKERQLAVHHPQKTWFIIHKSDGGTVLVGNICPHLTPLHVIFKQPPDSVKQRGEYLLLLGNMFAKYFGLAKNFGCKLDEGLSNFAVDRHGEVFYLDDEYYTWDSFIAFAVMLGVFIRNYDWLDKPFVTRMTKQLALQIDEIFHDPHCRVIIGSQLQSLFMPTPEKELLLKRLLRGMAMPPEKAAVHLANKRNLNARKNNNNRYFGVMADIHANDSALECVLDFYRAHNITQGIVLGDIVGYGPEPARCIDLLKASSFEIIKGNHDHAVATANVERGFSGNAKIAIQWTIGQLSQAHKDWLNNLPAHSHNRHWLAVHGAPIDPAFFYGYVYPLTAEENLDYLQKKDIALCFHGHSHMPCIFARDSRRHDHHVSEKIINLDHYNYVLACPGSVGQPRNGVPMAQCAIYDRELHSLEFFSLAYPLDSVIGAMQRYGLPEVLWRRLQTGK